MILAFPAIFFLSVISAILATDTVPSKNLRGLSDFAALDDTNNDLQGSTSTLVQSYHPLFDFDGDSCLPAAAISRDGEQNGGLKPTGSVTGQCRSDDFLEQSNTYFRSDSVMANDGTTYEVHLFELYFEKDQFDESGTLATLFGNKAGGHRHDIESVLIFFKDQEPVLMAVSQHGGYDTRSWSDVLLTDGNHPKVVYHKDNVRTHDFRFAKSGEDSAENPTHDWVLPPLSNFYNVTGNDLSNHDMRTKLNEFDFGAASMKSIDTNCMNEVEKVRTQYISVLGLSSDSPPLFGFGYTYSHTFGGNGGDPFDDAVLLRGTIPTKPKVNKVAIRSGRRVDAVELTLNDGTFFTHGGSTGHYQYMDLATNEYIERVQLYLGSYNGYTVIFQISVKTNQGRVLKGGSETNDGPYDISSPYDSRPALVGFFGKSGPYVNQLGGLFV